jgi:UPF0716 protein FxsA
MGLRLLFLFVVVPLIELTLLVRIGGVIGLANTILIVVLTGIVGTALARHQGMSVWRRFNARIANGEMPGSEIIDGLIILVCGALLMTPGVLTDIIGLLGLIPLSRGPIRKLISAYVGRQTVSPSTPFSRVSFGSSPFESSSREKTASKTRAPGKPANDITEQVETYRNNRPS